MFGAKGISLIKLYHLMCHWIGVLTRAQNLGASPLKIWEGKKRLKFGAI